MDSVITSTRRQESVFSPFPEIGIFLLLFSVVFLCENSTGRLSGDSSIHFRKWLWKFSILLSGPCKKHRGSRQLAATLLWRRCCATEGCEWKRRKERKGGDGCGRGDVFGIFKDACVPPKSDSERLSPFLRPSRSVGENLSSHLPPSLSALVSLALAAEVGTEHEPEVPVAAYKECHTIGGIVLFLFFFFFSHWILSGFPILNDALTRAFI